MIVLCVCNYYCGNCNNYGAGMLVPANGALWCILLGCVFCESLGYIRAFGSRGVGVSAVVISAGLLLAGFLVWLRG